MISSVYQAHNFLKGENNLQKWAERSKQKLFEKKKTFTHIREQTVTGSTFPQI